MATVGRYIPLIGLFALVPVVVYAIGRNDVWIALSITCVLIIVGSLRWMMTGWNEGPSPTPHTDHGP
jgi:ABC-type proline/glycine betaine transport system permease subunit